MQITELLARRTDLSTFLVHLTREAGGRTARDNLLQIITTNTLRVLSSFGPALKALNEAHRPTDSQRCVCFTETPLEHVSLLTEPLDEPRNIQFERYGIAITRKQGRRRRVNPVWYLDMTPAPGHNWLTNAVSELVDAAVATGNFDAQPIARLAPFMDWIGVWPTGRKEFWWEREWRHRGDFTLPPTYIALCPESEHGFIDTVVSHIEAPARPTVQCVDPAWSLEVIIGRLAGFSRDDVGPF